MNPKKLSVLLASLTPLLVLIIVFIATGPWQQPVTKPAVPRQIDPAPSRSLLQARRESYETIEAYLRQTYESGVLPAGHEVEIDLLYWPYSSTDPIKNYFYTQGVPQEVYDAIDRIPVGGRIILTANDSRKDYRGIYFTVHPAFTLISLPAGRANYYIYFPEDTDAAHQAFFDVLPTLHYGNHAQFFHMEDNWYAALS